MDGTAFLVLFVIFIVSTVTVLAVAKSNLDNTDKLPIPAIPPEVDPFEVAYLRGGANELARSVVFSLVQKRLVEIVNGDKFGRIRRVEPRTEVRGLTQMEQLALTWIGVERDAKDVFDAKTGLTYQLEQSTAKYQIDLSNRQFLMPEDLTGRARKFAWTAAALIVGLGGYKVVVAVMIGRFNIILTIVFMVIAFFIAMTMGRMPRVTKLGKQYLERLQLAFEDLKYWSQAPYIGLNANRSLAAEVGFSGVDPLLLSVGVFGTGILAGTMFSGYNDAFAKAQQQQAAGSGCGSSSCGSSCGSGDGGGGGSCGGGCGGCS